MSLNVEETYKNKTPRTSADFEGASYGAQMSLIWLSAYEWDYPMHPNYSGEKDSSNGRFKLLKIWISLSVSLVITKGSPICHPTEG